MPGLIIQDQGGGDHHWTVVDDKLWKQIQGLPGGEGNTIGSWAEVVEWLCCDDPDVDRSSEAEAAIGCTGIERHGKILKKFFTQRYVFEVKKLDSILGILVLP